MTFRPDKLHVYGEIDVRLSNRHLVKAKIEFNETGEVQLTFADPDMVARWLMTTLDNKLIELQIVTVTSEPTDHLARPDEKIYSRWNCPNCGRHQAGLLKLRTNACAECGHPMVGEDNSQEAVRLTP